MATPENHKSIKTSLSTMKKGPVKGLRNILANPQEFLWPIVKDERGAELQKLLNELLPIRRNNSREISWAQLQKMSKEERGALKQINQLKRKENSENGIINEICLGINAVTRALEKDNLAAVVVDSNVEPLIMIKHVVIMSRNNNIPVILVSFLKNCTLQRLGFASAALGLNKSSMGEKTSNCQKLHKKILNLAEEFSIAENSIELFNDEGDAGDETKRILLKTSKQQALSTDVYSHRKSIEERIFIPPQAQNNQKNQETSGNEFILLRDDIDTKKFNERASHISKMKRYIDIHEQKPKKELKKNSKAMGKEIKSNEKKEEIENTKKGKIYCPLKVKRVKGNLQRLKSTKTPKMKRKLSAERKN